MGGEVYTGFSEAWGTLFTPSFSLNPQVVSRDKTNKTSVKEIPNSFVLMNASKKSKDIKNEAVSKVPVKELKGHPELLTGRSGVRNDLIKDF